MLCINNSIPNVPETNFKEKIRCGEVYRNLNGNYTFQKFYYRCLECSMDFESGSDFEEHVIGHYLQEDDEIIAVDENSDNAVNSGGNGGNVIDISSDEDENEFLCAVEVTSIEETISASDLPLSLMQMLNQTTNAQQQQQNQQPPKPLNIDEDVSENDSNEKGSTFPCKGLLNRSLQPYPDPDRCCPSCPGYYNSDIELDEHKIVHTLPDTVMCPHCYEVFANVIKLQQHTRIRRKKSHRSSTSKKPTENTKGGSKKKAITVDQSHSQNQDSTIKMDTDAIENKNKAEEISRNSSDVLINDLNQFQAPTILADNNTTNNKDKDRNDVLN